MNFKDFNDFKLKIEEMNNNDYQESLNDLFYFFKDQVEKDEYKEWRPDVEVTYFGLNNEFDKGITFTLGEASEFLKTKFFSGKIEAVENFHNDNTKDVKAWTPPEAKVPEEQTPNVQRESNFIRNDDDDLEIDHNISVDDEENFNNQEDEEPEEEESFEEFLEDFLGDDEDSDDEVVGPKDKNKSKKKKKVKVLGEELPFEDDGSDIRQKEMATEKAMIDDARNRRETLSQSNSEEPEIIEDEQTFKSTEEVVWPEQDFGVDDKSFGIKEDETVLVIGSGNSVDEPVQTEGHEDKEHQYDASSAELGDQHQEIPTQNGDLASTKEESVYNEKGFSADESGRIDNYNQFDEQFSKDFDQKQEHSRDTETLDFEEQAHGNNEDYRGNTEPSGGSEQPITGNDGLLEIDFGEDWNNSEEAKLVKLAEEKERDSINPILGVAAGISKVLNGKDYEYQGEDAKLFGQHETEEVDHQKEAATEAAMIELARKRAEQNVQIELIEEDDFEQTGSSYGQNEMNRSHKTMEEAFNETINKMGNDLDDINQYDEHGQVIQPEVIIDKMLSEDENAKNAFNGYGSAGDMSAFGQAFKDFASQMGNGSGAGSRSENNVADILNGLVMGMAFTGSGDQIRETVPDPIVSPSPLSTEHIRGVHESVDGRNLGVESGFNLDDYGNLKSAAQERYEAEKRDNYEIGQDTRDIQKLVDASVADKDARDAVMVQSYGQEMITMPANTMMQGEEFNRVYMEHFADVTSVEFSATPIPENVQTVDFSVAGNGAVLGYEENGVLYITSAPPVGSDLSIVMEPQVYLNPDSAGMFKDAINLQSISFGDNVADTSFVHNMGGMFINCENLTTVNADYLNTERLQNIDGLFANCSNLETFNNEGWKTSNVITASFAFSECHALTQDPSIDWRMENLRYADGFMSGCMNLTNIDMSNWNARSLLSTREMFNGCSSAEYININGLDTINVKDMAGMFKSCANLEDVNLSKLNTSSLSPVVEGKGGVEVGYQGDLGHPIDDIFYGCTKLAESGEFKSQAMAWEASANRAVELNSPVYMEHKSQPTSYEQLGVPVVTEVQNKDGSMSRMTSYHNQDGSTTFIIPTATPQFNYENEAQIQYNSSPVTVMSKPNNDGTTSVITSKTYSDNSRVVQTEVIGVDGQVIHGNVVSYDKFGMKISDIPLTKIDELAKNNPLFVSSKVNEDGSISIMTSKTYADNSKIIKTETYGNDGTMTKESVVSFDGNGMKIPEVPAFKMEDLAVISTAVVLATVNRDGTSSVITSKAYADNSHVVKTEMFGRDGNATRENVVSYDKNGMQTFSVPADKIQDIQQDALKLSSLKVNLDGSVSVRTVKTLGDNSRIVNTETFGQNGAVKNDLMAYDKNGMQISNVPASKLEELAKMSAAGITFATGSDGSITITTSKVFADNSKVIKTEEFAKNGSLLKESIVGYDKNSVHLENIPAIKLEELLKSNNGEVEFKRNQDGTISIMTSQMHADNAKTIRTEVLAKDGNVVQDNVATYDKHGTKISEIPATKMEDYSKAGSIFITSKVDKDGVTSIVTEKTYADRTRVVQTETIRKDGTIVKDVIAYDQNRKQLSNISQDKLAELAIAKKLEVNTKNDGHQIIMTVPKTDGTKATTTINVDKNGKYITNTTVYGKDGNSKIVNSPVFTKGEKAHSDKSFNGMDEKTKRRRESKGNEDHIFGNSKSSNERKIYDAAKLKRDQDLYKTGKVIEDIGRGAQPVFRAAWSAIKGLTDNPQDESLMAESKKALAKHGNVFKTVVGGVFGISIAASLQAEKTDFNKIMKAAQTAKGAGLESKLAEKGLTLESLQKKSQREVAQTLSGLKDSHGKRLLSDKEIRNIAKHRNGAVEMVSFEKTIANARDAGLFEKVSKNGKGLTSAQEKALEKFNSGRLDKLKAKDIANLADAYFERASASQLHGLKVSKLSKKELDDIISGKNPHINFNKLSDTEKSLLKAARRTSSIKSKARDIRTNQALKRLNPFSFRQGMELLKKTGSGLAQETSQLLSDTYRKAGLVYTGATTAISVVGIYGGLALKGVKFSGKLLAKTPPGKIVIKAGGKVVSAIGNSFIGKSAKAVGEGFKEVGDAAKGLKKAYKETKKKAKEKAKEKITVGAKKASDKIQRTVAGKLAAKAAGKAKMIAQNKTAKGVGKVLGTAGKLISAPFKGLAWAGGKLSIAVNAVRTAINKLLLYAAAGLAGFVILIVLLIMLISIVAGGGSAGVNINSSIMSPPNVDINGNPLNLSDAEYQSRWDEFKILIQKKYQDSKDEQQEVVDSVDDIFGEIPNINGNPIIGWAGEQIMEYGVSSDITVNDGYWIAYEPVADDNAKDAIAMAYIIMGSKDFYYNETARNKLIEDLIPLMNPELEESDITNTVYPGSTYADESKKIYACLTGCETLTYYCADESAYSNFSKSGCVSKSKDYTGTKAVKDLEDCVRLSTDGTTIVANETKIPNAAEPVLYADTLMSHNYGDSYTSTCTGNETVTIDYTYYGTEYGQVDVNTFMDQNYQYYDYTEYYSHCWDLDCPYTGDHYHLYTSPFAGERTTPYHYYYSYEFYGYKTTAKSSSTTAKLSELGASHGTKTQSGGINNSSQVVGPTESIYISSSTAKNYVENETGRDVIDATVSTPSSTCSSWSVKFMCHGHTINTCPNGHTDLGVTISQYSAEDFKCFGGSKLDLPSNSLYNSYINEFMALDTREGALAMIKAIVENDWHALYGVNDQKTLAIAENSSVSEAFIYNILISESNETGNGLGMGMSKAQAAAFLGYIKVASNFKINAESAGYYGLCLWADDQLERIGRGSSDNQATLLEQLTLLNNEYSDVSLNCGFAGANDLVEFRSCEDTLVGAQDAAKILVEKWTFGHVDDVSAVQAEAAQYFTKMSGGNPEFSNPCLKTISNYVSWALKTASSPEHGYCQGKFQNGAIGDFNCGTFVDNAVREGTRGTDDEVAGWPDGRFQVLSFPSGATEADLQFGDLIYDPMEAGDTSDHIEIYIGNGCSVGARGADGNFGCSQNDERWTKHPSSWTDHVFHKSGDQGIRWKNGSYTYNEIAASSVDLSKYKTVYRLQP